MTMLNIAVAGASGRMGRMLIEAIQYAPDARLAGARRSACPYASADDMLRTAWLSGWQDVHDHYAALVRGRWKIRPLVALEKTA